MKQVKFKDLINGKYYLAYTRYSQGIIIGIGAFEGEPFCLMNSISYNTYGIGLPIKVFVIRPKWFGLDVNVGTQLFELDKDEILRHIVAEDV